MTLIQIDNYGPWTVTPEPRRGVDLQTLQSRLYADVSQLVGNREGHAFFGRFDNVIAVTNGLDATDHALIQGSIGSRYLLTASMSIGTNASPTAALGRASDRLQDAGSAQDDGRREALRGEPLSDTDRTDTDVQLAHFDVNDATDKIHRRTQRVRQFHSDRTSYAELMRYMREAHDPLSFRRYGR